MLSDRILSERILSERILSERIPRGRLPLHRAARARGQRKRGARLQPLPPGWAEGPKSRELPRPLRGVPTRSDGPRSLLPSSGVARRPP
ncbi:MAG: hypothetical protein HY791_08210 [Deltaproteobacteria bacterium]|nr:hypothetical protein [Deltaproteobacteria bacterium]